TKKKQQQASIRSHWDNSKQNKSYKETALKNIGLTFRKLTYLHRWN
ncbi:unnamed protein product, partial [Brassica rapa]